MLAPRRMAIAAAVRAVAAAVTLVPRPAAALATAVGAADALSGEVSALPIVAAFASVVAQTHVALLPSALAVGGVATIGGLAAARQNRNVATIRRSLLLATLTLLVLWVLPLIEQLT